MKTLSLALRNLLRNRRRSLTSLLALVIGAVTVLVFGGYARNITLSLQTGYVLRGGHLQLQRKDYFLYGSGNPAAYGIADYKHVIDVVAHDPVLAPMITVVTPTISLGGIAGNFAAGVSRTIIGSGIVVADRNRMRHWNDYGLPFNPGDTAYIVPPFHKAEYLQKEIWDRSTSARNYTISAPLNVGKSFYLEVYDTTGKMISKSEVVVSA